MAIEIKRTPVLKGKAAADFINSLPELKTKETAESIRHAIAKTKKILSSAKISK